MVFENGVKNIQAAAYNGTFTVVQNSRILKSNSNGSQNLSYLKVAKEINKQGKFAVVASYNEENCTIPLENVDVHSILLDSQKSINYIMSCFKHRKRRNREPWMLQFQVKSRSIQWTAISGN